MEKGLYFAPLEGITTYIYRNLHNEMFGGCDEYYAPFISPSDNEKIGKKGFRDIMPEKNEGVKLKVQALTNNASSFLKFSQRIKELGYDEVNLNLGCPSGTVVGKGRGSGFLRVPDMLDAFLDEIFSKADVKISVKTRAGYESTDELEKLMDIYNKYPMKLLIIHPRTRTQMYKGAADLNAYENAYSVSKNILCYNGDVFSLEDYNNIIFRFPKTAGVMLGRGAIQNPAIFREIKGGERLTTKELLEFTYSLEKRYSELLDFPVYTVHKLKEVWIYMMMNFPDENKILKAVKKANKPSELISAVEALPEIKRI